MVAVFMMAKRCGIAVVGTSSGMVTIFSCRNSRVRRCDFSEAYFAKARFQRRSKVFFSV